MCCLLLLYLLIILVISNKTFFKDYFTSFIDTIIYNLGFTVIVVIVYFNCGYVIGYTIHIHVKYAKGCLYLYIFFVTFNILSVISLWYIILFHKIIT